MGERSKEVSNLGETEEPQAVQEGEKSIEFRPSFSERCIQEIP